MTFAPRGARAGELQPDRRVPWRAVGEARAVVGHIDDRLTWLADRHFDPAAGLTAPARDCGRRDARGPAEPSRRDVAESIPTVNGANRGLPGTAHPGGDEHRYGEGMPAASTRHFYDQLAERYHLLYPDWDASIGRQGQALDALIQSHFGPGSRTVLDCAGGIGTQAIGLAAHQHRIVATDLSPIAITRAAREALQRQLSLPAAAADMRALPFRPASFDVIVCADNALPHLLTASDVHAALANMHRTLRPGGLLLITTRPYDLIRKTQPRSTPPQVGATAAGRAITFQLWDWHRDGEHYDLELFQLMPHAGSWSITVFRATYWALTQDQITSLVTSAGFRKTSWHTPEDTGFFQPLLSAQARGG